MQGVAGSNPAVSTKIKQERKALLLYFAANSTDSEPLKRSALERVCAVISNDYNCTLAQTLVLNPAVSTPPPIQNHSSALRLNVFAL